jgi:Zn ribbon nucleic-acid-binding protein
MDCPLCKDNDVVATDSKDKAGFEYRCRKCGHDIFKDYPNNIVYIFFLLFAVTNEVM